MRGGIAERGQEGGSAGRLCIERGKDTGKEEMVKERDGMS